MLYFAPMDDPMTFKDLVKLLGEEKALRKERKEKTNYPMDEKIIHLDEIRLRRSIQEAENALRKARDLKARGHDVPPETMTRLEELIGELEDRLCLLIDRNTPLI